MRGWLIDAGAPAAIGTALAESVNRDFAKLSRMDDEQLASHYTQVYAQVQRLWGADADRKLDLARRLIGDVERKRPGLKDWLNDTGLGSNIDLIVQAYNLAERRYGGGR